MIVSFLYKVKKLKNRDNETITLISVFDPIIGQTKVIKSLCDEDHEGIRYILLNDPSFNYKNLSVNFKSTEEVKF